MPSPPNSLTRGLSCWCMYTVLGCMQRGPSNNKNSGTVNTGFTPFLDYTGQKNFSLTLTRVLSSSRWLLKHDSCITFPSNFWVLLTASGSFFHYSLQTSSEESPLSKSAGPTVEQADRSLLVFLSRSTHLA